MLYSDPIRILPTQREWRNDAMKTGKGNPITMKWICDTRVFLAVAFSIGYTVSSTKAKVLIGAFIDQLPGITSYRELMSILLLAGISLVMGYGMWKSSNSYIAKVQSTLYQRIICSVGVQPKKKGKDVGKITTLMTQDVNAVLGCIRRILQKIVPDTTAFFAAVAILWVKTHWFIAVTAVLLCLVQAAFTYGVNTKINTTRHFLQQILEESNQKAFHGIENMEAIKAYRLEDVSVEAYSGALGKYNRIYQKIDRKTALFSAISMLLSFLVMLWITVACGKLVAVGQITIGTFFVAMTLLENLIDPIMCLDRSVKILVSTKVNVHRLLDDLATSAEEKKERFPAPCGSIAFDNVSFGYKGSEEVLHNVSFQCTPGRVNYIVGKNGCGKSTVVKLLLGEEKPSGGRIFVCGAAIGNLSPKELTQNMAVCTQDTVILPTTILNNLRFGSDSVTEDEVRSVCEAVGIHSEIDALPEKYNTLLQDLGEPLSLGQRKRIALARTLLKNGYIYIFDEPSVGLDLQNTLRIKRVFETLSQDHIVIVITHDAVLLDESGHKIRMEGAEE